MQASLTITPKITYTTYQIVLEQLQQPSGHSCLSLSKICDLNSISGNGKSLYHTLYQRQVDIGRHRQTQVDMVDIGRHRQTQGDIGRHRETQVDIGRHRQTQVDTGRHRQTQVDTGRHRQTQVDLGRPRQTQVDIGRHMQTQVDIGRYSQVDTGRHRQTQVDIGRHRYIQVYMCKVHVMHLYGRKCLYSSYIVVQWMRSQLAIRAFCKCKCNCAICRVVVFSSSGPALWSHRYQ